MSAVRGLQILFHQFGRFKSYATGSGSSFCYVRVLGVLGQPFVMSAVLMLCQRAHNFWHNKCSTSNCWHNKTSIFRKKQKAITCHFWMHPVHTSSIHLPYMARNSDITKINIWTSHITNAAFWTAHITNNKFWTADITNSKFWTADITNVA